MGFFIGRVMGLPPALGQCRGQPGRPIRRGVASTASPAGEVPFFKFHWMVFYPPAGGPFPSSPITLMNNINKDRP